MKQTQKVKAALADCRNERIRSKAFIITVINVLLFAAALVLVVEIMGVFR